MAVCLKSEPGRHVFLKAMQLPLHDSQASVKHPKNASSLQNTMKQTMKSRCRQTESSKSTNSCYRCLLTMNYLSQRTPHWAWGLWRILSVQGWRPPARVGGQGSRRKREMKREGGGRGRTSRLEGTVPPANRALPGALKKLGGTIPIRKQGPVER